jgi:hypothetical protein
MLICHHCGLESTGSGWHWIGIVIRVDAHSPHETVVFCPRCAESEYGYFTERRRRRLHEAAAADDAADDY